MVSHGKQHREKIGSVKPVKSQLNVLNKLKLLDWNLHVIWGDKGIPSHLCGVLSVEIEEDAENAARKFLSENFKLFKMKESLEDMIFLRKTDSLGGCHVVFQQGFAGLSVYNALTSVHLDKNNRVNKIDVCYHPDLFAELPAEGMSRENAICIALDALHGEKRLTAKAF